MTSVSTIATRTAKCSAAPLSCGVAVTVSRYSGVCSAFSPLPM